MLLVLSVACSAAASRDTITMMLPWSQGCCARWHLSCMIIIHCGWWSYVGALCAAGGEVMELQEFYEYMEQNRAAAVESAVQRYRSLTPLLGKVTH